MALLDRDGVYGIPRFHKAAVAAGIRPIIGAELDDSVGRVEWVGWGESPAAMPSEDLESPSEASALDTRRW